MPKFNLVLASSSLNVLDELAQRNGKNRGQVLRDALSLAKYISDTEEQGGTVFIEREGKTFELVLK